METWPSILPIWLASYSSTYENSVRRTTISGFTAQRRAAQRNLERINVSLRLRGAEVAIFEYFVQELLNEGQDKFTGSYIDNGTVQTGNIKIVGGRYLLRPQSTTNWTASCQIEVERDHA